MAVYERGGDADDDVRTEARRLLGVLSFPSEDARERAGNDDSREKCQFGDGDIGQRAS